MKLSKLYTQTLIPLLMLAAGVILLVSCATANPPSTIKLPPQITCNQHQPSPNLQSRPNTLAVETAYINADKLPLQQSQARIITAQRELLQADQVWAAQTIGTIMEMKIHDATMATCLDVYSSHGSITQ